MKKALWIIFGILAFLIVSASLILVIQPSLIIRPLSSVTDTCIGGVNILISTASHRQGDEFFHGEATANLGAECFKIAWTEEDIEEDLAEGGEADKGIFGDILIDSQTNVFHTKERTYELVESYYVKTYDTYISCSNDDCENWLEDDNIRYRRVVDSNLGWGDCNCIYTMERGTFAPFTGARERHFAATISIDGLGSKEITDEDSTVNFGDQASFWWQGDLLGTRWIDTPYSYTPFREGNNYDLVSTSYNNFKSEEVIIYSGGLGTAYRIDEFDYCILGELYMSNIRACINAYNDKVDELLKDRTNEYLNSIDFANDAEWDTDEGDLIVDLEPYSTSYPRFTFDIKAAWLGIHYVTGKPRVTCPNDQEGVSGEIREFEFKVKNIADEQGVFQLSLDCGTLSETISPSRVTLASGVETTISATAKGTTEQVKTDTCTFLAYAVKDKTQEHSCAFTYKTKPKDVCTPKSDRKCSKDKTKLLICNKDGTGWDETECPNGCVYDDDEGAKCAGDPSCKEKGEVCGEDKDCCSGLECKGNICKTIEPGWQWDNLYFLPILLTIGLAALFGWKGKQKSEAKAYNYVDFIIGGVLGLGAGIGAYFILKHWVMVLIIGLIGGGGALALILFIGGIPLLLALLSIMGRKK